jgi:hypothetical protein
MIRISICCFLLLFATACQKKKNTSKNMVALDMAKGKALLKVGQFAYVAYQVHGSVGIEGEAKSQNTNILKFVKKQFRFDNPADAKQALHGGDSGKEFAIFKALKVGKTEVIVKDVFRGEPQKTYKIQVIVL